VLKRLSFSVKLLVQLVKIISQTTDLYFFSIFEERLWWFILILVDHSDRNWEAQRTTKYPFFSDTMLTRFSCTILLIMVFRQVKQLFRNATNFFKRQPLEKLLIFKSFNLLLKKCVFLNWIMRSAVQWHVVWFSWWRASQCNWLCRSGKRDGRRFFMRKNSYFCENFEKTFLHDGKQNAQSICSDSYTSFYVSTGI